ncbi:MAG: C40 family peptidase [Fimbriimonadales bacterium]|nr:C40 family peptidase [Fimbriimonadales bacterium]
MPQSRSLSSRSATRQPDYVTHRIGRLIETTRPTPIYAQPHAGSPVLYPQVSAQFYLMMAQQRGQWYGVLMTNGALGWIPKRSAKLTPFDVVYTLPRGADPNHVTRLAMRFLGVRYRWGGNDPRTGLDCSGFVKMIYAQMGINLPRRARDQAKVGVPITHFEDLRPGDRLYFAVKGREIDHTGIYIGDGYFIHSARSRGGVDVDHLSHPTYRRSLVSARR